MFFHKQLIIKEDIWSKNIVVCRCLYDSMPSYLYSIHYFSLKYKNPPFCCNCSRFFSFFTRLQHDHFCPKSDLMIDVYFTFFALILRLWFIDEPHKKIFYYFTGRKNMKNTISIIDLKYLIGIEFNVNVSSQITHHKGRY